MHLTIQMDIENDHLETAGPRVPEVARLIRELADKLEKIGEFRVVEDALTQPDIMFHDEENGKHRIARAEVNVSDL